MSVAERFHLATVLPVANVAIPNFLIVLVLLVAGLLTGGIALSLVYLYRRLSPRSDAPTDR